MASKLRRLQYVKVALVDQGANPQAHIHLFKRDTTMSKTTPTVEEVTKERDEAVAKNATLEAEIADLKKKLPAAPPEPVKLPEAVQKQLDDLAKRNETLEAEVAKQNEARKLTEAVSKAAVFKALGNPDDIGTLLYQVRKNLQPEVVAAFEKNLAAWNERIRQGALFKALGTPSIDADSPEGQLDALAKAKAEKDGIPYELAYSKVCDTPDGVKLLKATRKGGN